MYDEFKSPVNIQTQCYYTSNVSFKYPMVYGLSDPMIQQRMNYRIYSLMLEVISELINPYSNTITYVTGFYEIKTNERDVLSITLNATGDFGGAHPMSVVKALTFDVKTGDEYELYQLFLPDSDYIQRMSDMIAIQIKERDIPLLGDFKGISPTQDYYIADKALVIFFQLYEIAPYAAGFPYFVIPIYDVSDIIVPDGLLSRMLYWL
ncbi:DUF3298 and DUF4163 domain-containing protein [Alkaliphilus serpentinus]|uniref:DUF3298 and DUF4163 domain-containing protein n=1 Tax=Alkaliphilus serpentinus TaxID=1482731 RepID=A0A833HQ81_9FIRM|nr:DUF3298 and DUF4163 domain-containing protein [Alkaliphilus serpentinus]KAB3531537.1 DUF3298 and DUF4163 domain-containing protein [Alkaliphilus serpentinus]